MTEPRPPYSLPLAHGELSPRDAQELQALKEQIKRDIGFYSDGYKEHCLRRRIAVRMRARGVHSYGAYGDLLTRDESERHKLLDAVTINVSKFYRNRELWTALEQNVVPKLFDMRARPLRLWSAGCAAGEEPYTIAMVLKEYALRAGRERDLLKFNVVGSDIDVDSLKQAQLARYGPFAFTDIDAEVRRHWFVEPELNELKKEIRGMVRFKEKDLIKEEFEGGHQLIMCRNVIIYFEREIQELLFAKFHEALAPGGYLVLGKVESLFGRPATLFKPVVSRERIFMKV
ncbi:MAG: CheR family methyltransferase [Gemmatimonadota bacterium]